MSAANNYWYIVFERVNT